MRVLFGSIFCLSSAFCLSPISQAQTTATFKVGVSAPLSGDVAEFGVAVKNGIELARRRLSPALDHIQFIYEDNQYSGPVALSIGRKFVEQDKVDLMYLWGEPPLNAIAPLIEQKHLPTIAMSIDAKPAIGAKYIIRSINHPLDYANLLIQYIRSKNWKRLGLVTVEDPFIQALVSGLEALKASDEELDIFHNVLPGETDFRAGITKLSKRRYDAVGIYLLPGQTSAFYRQAKHFLRGLPTFGTDVFESHTEIQNSDGAMENAIFPAVVVPDQFRADYVSTYGNDTQITYAYNAYIFARRTSELFGPGSTAGSAEEIVQLFTRPDPAKAYVFRADSKKGNYFEFKLNLYSIHKGKFKKL